ncbi:carboxylating nicotinate-nucleotide diphosphorylase [Chloroflexota bacterium]
MRKPLTSEEQIEYLIDLALEEDTGQGDVTSDALIPPGLQGQASILVKGEGILAGIEVARQVFLKVDSSLEVNVLIEDGAKIKPGDIAATVAGKVASIMKTERLVLNFLGRLCGIATQTAAYVAETQDSKAIVIDTRKTTPGLRVLEKYAVRMGGGKNHRTHLGDGILIKDNHLEALYLLGMSLKDVVTMAKQNAPQGLSVEVEVNIAEEAEEAVAAGVDTIMLDNMSPDEMTRVVRLIPNSIKIEASGGITLDNLREVAATGVDFISIGALTHSVKALDVSLDLDPQSFEMP